MVRMWLAALALLIGLGLSHAADPKSSLTIDKRWEQGRKDYAQGKAGEAKSAFEELIRDYPNEADLHLFLGMAKLRLRDPPGAVLAAKRAIALNPQHVDARTFLAWVELEVRGDVDAAIREYKKIIEPHPAALACDYCRKSGCCIRKKSPRFPCAAGSW